MKLLLTLFFFALLPQMAQAMDFEKLFMPGKVIEGHAEYELKCESCHVRLHGKTQRKLCLDCHEKVADDVNAKQGFHGLDKQVIGVECRVCHTEHKGRDAVVIWLDKDRFDHKSTDYPLEGKHAQADCSGCHKEDKKYREAPDKCFSCHEDDDSHKTKLGKKCETCHNPKGWSSEQFDHDKTDFKLKHAHKKVACDLCHVGNKYKDTPKKCFSCHAIKDVHQNRFGKKCQDCHTEKKWDKTKFKHDRDTDFKLKGKHKATTCHTCHTVADSKKKKPKGKKAVRNCYSCHRLDDVHKGKNKKKCDKCHNETNWLDSSFDHDEKTEFPLKGAHKKANCQSCHQSDQKGKKTDKACYSCHKHQDVHKEQEGKECDNCHNEKSWWLKDVRFDHELTEFPLIGQHAVVGCESCHLTSKFKDTKSECINCHQEDDVHEKALGDDCKQCHNPNDWLIWKFDHDETDFKIRGAHKNLHCHACHFKPLDKDEKMKSRCIDCHYRDDIHEGSFGPYCDECHSIDDFKDINMNGRRIGS